MADDLTGQQFGRLIVTKRVSRAGTSHAYWACECACGVNRVVCSSALRCGTTTSCGCLAREKIVAATRTHGQTNTPLFRIWQGIVGRCTNPRNQAFANYGGRGIEICAEWRNDFMAFCAHVGDRPTPHHEIDRIDNDGHYRPGNVRWATIKQQANNRRTNTWLEHDGLRLTMKEWSERVGLPDSTIANRLYRRGWSVAAALSTPSERRRLTVAQLKELAADVDAGATYRAAGIKLGLTEVAVGRYVRRYRALALRLHLEESR